MSDEEYDFEYSDDELSEEEDVDIENTYYNAKGVMESSPKEALEQFEQVLEMQKEKGEWGFKALKQMVKIHFTLNQHEGMLKRYREMLTYIKSAVTRNYSEKAINTILDFVSTSDKMDFLENFYKVTLDALMEAKNERLWFKTQIKLGKIYFDSHEYGRLSRILKELHKSCEGEDGQDDHKKGTQLLEIYALEIQMYTEQKDTKKLKALYNRALTIKSAIPHPRIMGVIRECGGKMHMREREWEKAHTDFFEAFKSYDEAGVDRRIACLKYLVLANMLMLSDINPFDAQEAKPYKNDPQILAVTDLVGAYQRDDINAFEQILKTNKRTIMDDPFIRDYIEDLLKNIRTQVMIKLLKPYTRIRVGFISKELNIPESEVESLLVALILDGRIAARIDQVNGVVALEGASTPAAAKYSALDKWTEQLSTLRLTVSNKLA